MLQVVGISFDLIIIRVNSAAALKETVNETRPTISFTTMNPFSSGDKEDGGVTQTAWSAGETSGVTRKAESQISKDAESQ